MSASEERNSNELYTRTEEPDRLDGMDEDGDAPQPVLPEPKLLDLELPQSELDLTMTIDSIFAEMANSASEPEHKVHKRASNVMKLSQENESLKEQLRAMTERLEAAERKQRELEETKKRSNNATS
ncbi:hypothetical protein BXZ70DRAFT_916485 [Cristinia sonorae]|uniref:Uncharacterized protein n=1 Tax=Cristinia sonorae TaxID=1940300 RepID=A0A8K0XV24_9AGAR|nr:hypothetical protein BXZ70DRAFT_916485 [Cristinia sonorae]